MESKRLVRCKNICKYFGSSKVLDDVIFDIRESEVHALVGENGAGKTTLLKILFGVHKAESGEIYLADKKVFFQSPREARSSGIILINQEPLAFPNMTILENIFLGHSETRKGGIVDVKKMTKIASDLINDLGFNIDLKRRMKELSVAEMQMIEIISALSSNAKIILMDEPTASLTPNEVSHLLSIIDTLKKKGKSVVFISHRLDEVKKISDRVTVLRDGCVVGTFENKELKPADMIRYMLGCSLNELIKREAHYVNPEPYFEVENLTADGLFKDVSFGVGKGEIFGIAGLMGAGRTEIVCTIFGIIKKTGGTVKKEGVILNIRSPIDAIQNGIALVPEDRHGAGLFLDKSIAYNLTIEIRDKITKFLGFIDKKKENEAAQALVNTYRIKHNKMYQNIAELSGGNQQKVSLAKWIATEPEILILDEPTRGIDVGAKTEVYKIINQLAKKGKCIILISSELEELVKLSDKIMVVYEGKQMAIIDREEITEINVLAAAHGYNQ